MILPAIGTIATRSVIAVVNLLLVAVMAHHLGLEGVGIVALIILAITFIQLVNNVVGGGGLVYLVPRYGIEALRWPSYMWAILTAAAAWLLLSNTAVVPAGFEVHATLIALLRSIAAIHTGLLLGRERYGAHNVLVLVQAVLLLVAMALLLQHDGADPLDYVHAAYIADGTIALVSAVFLLDRNAQRASTVTATMDLFRQGLMAQLGNGIQLLNYRFTYYLVNSLHGSAALGLWSITTQLAESAWLVPKSLGTVLYARVSNLSDAEHQRGLTLVVLKVAVAVALLALTVLVMLPEPIYRYLFGPEVHGLAPLLLAMAPGLVAMSASQAISHYLSGSGRVYHNTIGSALGLVITVGLGYQLIPTLELLGAAITASAAYCVSLIYQIIIFNKVSGARLRHYLPNVGDMERITTLKARLLGR